MIVIGLFVPVNFIRSYYLVQQIPITFKWAWPSIVSANHKKKRRGLSESQPITKKGAWPFIL